MPALGRAQWDAVASTELALVVVDGSNVGSKREVEGFFSRLRKQLDLMADERGARTQTALVINKVDLVHPKERLLELSERLHGLHTFDGARRRRSKPPPHRHPSPRPSPRACATDCHASCRLLLQAPAS